MEAVSKNKRGRPSVYARYDPEHGGIVLKARAESAVPELSQRSKRNYVYIGCGMTIMDENEFEHKELLQAKSKQTFKATILEQIGRMNYQDGYSENDCVYILQVAANALYNGCTVKQIVKYIRHGRKTNEW